MSDNSIALRIEAVSDDLRLAHTKGVVMGTVMMRALADGGYHGTPECETKLRDFIATSRRSRDETRRLLDFLRSRLEYKQRVVEDVDSLIDQMTESLGIGDRTVDVGARLDVLFPNGAEFRRTDLDLPPCPVCSHRDENRVALSCGHSFCASCVRRSLSASPGHHFECFVCRRRPTDVIRLYL
jgi:hypothetical protein